MARWFQSRQKMRRCVLYTVPVPHNMELKMTKRDAMKAACLSLKGVFWFFRFPLCAHGLILRFPRLSFFFPRSRLGTNIHHMVQAGVTETIDNLSTWIVGIDIWIMYKSSSNV